MCFVGVDIGSRTTKAVLLQDNKIASFSIRPTGFDMEGIAEKVVNEVLQKANLSFKDVKKTVATGYGRITIDFADKQVTEILCHAKGAYKLFPSVRTVIDIGGQDSKGIKLNADGEVINFVINDKCAAGTGRFLELSAQALEVKLDKMGPLGLQAKSKAHISSICAVFAESEIISLLAHKVPKPDILAGIFDAISSRIIGMVRGIGLEPDFMLSGGVAWNIGVVRALEEQLNCKFLVPEQPEITGALGAALFAKDLQNH
jgi:predicted CoA-substrate-specific enzyme activase